jgi:hypothetical protein
MESLIQTFEADSCPAVWLDVVEYLIERRKPAYNLVLAIKNPNGLSATDFAVCDHVDAFLARHDVSPLNTIASTIFPAGFYLQGGAEAVFNEYPEAYNKVREGWGTYAYRMVRKSAAAKSGNKDDFIIPLKILVDKIKRQLTQTRFKAVYEGNFIEIDDLLELPTYDAALDATRTRRHPCLSHISFKLMPDDRIMLTALYRYHYYVEKALGNLLGLAQLLSFVAEETRLKVGPLVCHSTFAVLDTERWSAAEVNDLLAQCRSAFGSLATTGT